MNILVIEDNKHDAVLIIDALKPLGVFKHFVASTYTEFLLALRTEHWDVIISDYHMNDFNAIDVLKNLEEQGMVTPVVIVTGAFGNEAKEVMLYLGAKNYILKDKMHDLPQTVLQVLGIANDALGNSYETIAKLQKQIDELTKQLLINSVKEGRDR